MSVGIDNKHHELCAGVYAFHDSLLFVPQVYVNVHSVGANIDCA